jgi:hypothetical protein
MPSAYQYLSLARAEFQSPTNRTANVGTIPTGRHSALHSQATNPQKGFTLETEPGKRHLNAQNATRSTVILLYA